jgi:photosystem II stability/assembly factor-like uncharacterized protein
VAPDGLRAAYLLAPVVEEPNTQRVCIYDGTNWMPRTIMAVPDSGTETAMALKFTDPLHAWLIGGDEYTAGTSYVYRSIDGGGNWIPGALPASLSTVRIRLHDIFFAPDGTNGWIVGSRVLGDGPGYALVLHTTDAGATWTDISSTGVNLLEGADQLFTGFALDASNIWVGGDWGFLAHSNNGGL